MSVSIDRRKHVRVRPNLELPATVALAGDDMTLLQLVDISLGGLGLWIQRGKPQGAGDELLLHMKLGADAIEVRAVVRHSKDDGVCGVEFVDVSEHARDILNRYVSELAERGAMA